MITLEWLAFGCGALTVWCYGHSKMQGACLGIVTAGLFMTWGWLGGFWGAVTINVGFFVLHARNLKRSFDDDRQSG